MTREPGAITLEENDTRGRYVYHLDGAEAELTFSKAGDLWIVDHTGVPRAFEGRGVGAALARRAVADARLAGRKIVPLCSFVAAQFRRHPDWSDVLSA
ncbi:GNAT family N-acetyltransferase [Amaricoccus solimangrovi]|uniref:N-acetyltransferase n=1 Tax=Amaricoccus solimangrovi TaxID=2589815 RepID=A0A501WQ28_9RHOB|nr:GNAT family N-acetyltransferase [Amaricoccus solimangrovi]TPE50435.1 N-acetyltransferase [Amaricoccus solimangrovi]